MRATISHDETSNTEENTGGNGVAAENVAGVSDGRTGTIHGNGLGNGVPAVSNGLPTGHSNGVSTVPHGHSHGDNTESLEPNVRLQPITVALRCQPGGVDLEIPVTGPLSINAVCQAAARSRTGGELKGFVLHLAFFFAYFSSF